MSVRQQRNMIINIFSDVQKNIDGPPTISKLSLLEHLINAADAMVDGAFAQRRIGVFPQLFDGGFRVL